MIKIAAVCFAMMVSVFSLYAGVINRDEALKAAFPTAQIEYKPLFLTDKEIKEIEQISGTSVPSALVACYVATEKGQITGRAYLDTHTVRTKKESLLVILNADGTVKRVEVVAFLEPPEYQAPDRWYHQFDQKSLDKDLRVSGSIHPVTGATLTAKATTEAVRRVLATDQVVLRKGKTP